MHSPHPLPCPLPCPDIFSTHISFISPRLRNRNRSHFLVPSIMKFTTAVIVAALSQSANG